ncbi:2,6-dihydroxypyridine 3-hydroxylase [Rhodococcus sp. ACS1]|uniref:FAD binding domain-containing protein n=1 Tax=Rhodococcus sp. ACS1 TaxID=2028570 RepID=UPI000BB0F83F|nr:FAD binding domain-containing protein [Rhodococcus sp. ACS1]PBC47822.1 2,6-dihydroxypyridine 3-hydroxylase [Rhodococcus sp. ACS1]
MEISRIAVVGGSIGGLTTALLLRDAGFEVDVYERSTKPLSGFGTGIVVQPELVKYLVERTDTELDAISVPSSKMRYADAHTGVELGTIDAAWRFTSYDGIYRRLHEVFGNERYHLGKTVVGIGQSADHVELRFADGTDAGADFVVAADGGSSVIRQRLIGRKSDYAGYVTWRGLVSPGAFDQSTWGYFDDAFTYGLLSDGHLIAYPIPPRDGDEGRRLNFQWYWNVPDGAQLDELMTDCNGIRLPTSVHAHQLCVRQRKTLDTRADELAPPFAELVHAAENAFVTIVSDADVDATVYGRIALLGDAAITPRPHAAAGAAKAANDAWTLADALSSKPGHRVESLAEWERTQLAVGRAYLAKVRQMAGRLQTGGDFPPGEPAFRFGLPKIGEPVSAGQP